MGKAYISSSVYGTHEGNRGQNMNKKDNPNPHVPEPVSDPEYWKERLGKCGGEIHRAIFNGSIDQFNPINSQHKSILAREIKPNDSILDAGCGYGRILSLMPSTWEGDYLGVDVSPDLIQIARLMFADRKFICEDLRSLSSRISLYTYPTYDVAIVSSIKHMIIRNLGQEEWDKMEEQIRKVSRRILYLEYGQWD